jgi:hypothetical protein
MIATPQRDASRVGSIGVIVAVLLGIGIAVLRSVNANPVERAAQVAGTIAFAAVFAAPAVLGAMALREGDPCSSMRVCSRSSSGPSGCCR